MKTNSKKEIFQDLRAWIKKYDVRIIGIKTRRIFEAKEVFVRVATKEGTTVVRTIVSRAQVPNFKGCKYEYNS